MGKLDGRVAIVTGSSRGIGKCVALALAKESCDIVVAARVRLSWGQRFTCSHLIETRAAPGHVGCLISKMGKTLIAHGVDEEVCEDNVGVTALWPASVVESQATINFGLLDRKYWRKA